MADQLGSYTASTTVRFMFTTHAATGAPVAPSSAFESADLILYKDGSATQRTSASGITMTSPFDSITGLHAVAIDLSDNTDAGFYAAGSEYVVVLSPDETVDSLAVAKVLAYFSIERVPKVNVTQFGGSAGTFSSGRPEVNTTHIAGTISPATAGYVGIDWAQISGKTTTNALTGTTIATTQKVDVETIKTNAVVNGGTITFPTGATLASTTNITAGTITTVTNLTNAPTSGDLTATMKTSVTTACTASTPIAASVTGAVGSVTGAVGSVTGAVGSVTGNVGGNVTGSVGSIATGGITTASFFAGATIPRCTLTDTITTYTGNTLQTGDSYDRIGATGSGLTSLATAANLATAITYIDTEVAAILADTNELQTDLVNGGRLDLLVDAIKAKTDLIPASPAAVGSAMTLDLTQAVATSNTAQTMGDCLNAARAQGFGKWAISGTTLSLYANDGTTVVKSFTLDSASTPTSRTPA